MSITIKTKDNHSFDVTIKVASVMQYTVNALKLLENLKVANTEIHLNFPISGSTLRFVLMWCEYHCDDFEKCNENPVVDVITLKDDDNNENNVEEVKPWKQILRSSKAKTKINKKIVSKYNNFLKTLEINHYVCDWDLEFFKDIEFHVLLDIGKAAAFLQIKGLIEVTAKMLQKILINQYSSKELFRAYKLMMKDGQYFQI